MYVSWTHEVEFAGTVRQEVAGGKQDSSPLVAYVVDIEGAGT